MAASLPIDDLTRLLSGKPELAAALNGAATPQAAAELLADAARGNGIAVDPAALAAFYRQQAAGPGGTLSDDDLDRISAGGVGTAVLVSIVTFGIGCAVVSLKAQAARNDCGEALKDGKL
ncbi:hypothetical protein [Azospirillum thermophilum]|nr:hypothetical protein [Azospirillum thermophilum]